MKRNFVPLVFSALALTAACNQNKDLKEVQKVQKAAKEAHSGTGTFIHSAVVEIKGPAAVYFHPDSNKLTVLEKSMGDEFFTRAEESMYDISSSREYLIGHKINVMETEARELRFEKEDGSVKVIDLGGAQYTWGLFLFNGKTDPIQVDMQNPQQQIERYLKK
ncbi:MAG TPA: hypothetical protein VGE15_01050 [Sphingobacteriaceae bacterium]